MKKYSHDTDKNLIKEDIRFYSSLEEQELSRLKEAINRTDTEKFLFLMSLMKLQKLMRKGSLHHKD
jgi:hypothetical protein